MNRTIIFSIILSVFFLNVASLKAQTVQKEKQPLIVVLKALSETYNISFSYADATINDKEISTPNKELSLEEVIEFLKLHTKLDFELLNNRFVVIKAKKRNGMILGCKAFKKLL